MKRKYFYFLILKVIHFFHFALSQQKAPRLVTFNDKLGSDELKIAEKYGNILMKISEDAKNLPPEGIPFPNITGPKPEDDVCIVGAGPAGIHMALRLDSKGYKKIRIFENTDRVGGKSYDINLEGQYRAQGTIFGSIDYDDNLLPLAQNFSAGYKHVYPRPGVRQECIAF